MRIFINAAAASAGGGVTYIRNVVPHLSCRPDVEAVVLIAPQAKKTLEGPNISFVELPDKQSANVLLRFWYEQSVLPALIRGSGADVLLSAGNFALRNSPVPQILLSGNSLYTSSDFRRDLRFRREYKLLMETYAKGYLAKQSIRWATCTVAPSCWFAAELQNWSGQSVRTIYHGFDQEAFCAGGSALPEAIAQQLRPNSEEFRMLFVSHYNYYRNFETLVRAIPMIQKRIAPSKVKLVLTCKLGTQENASDYRSDSAAALVAKLGVTENIVQLGPVPYHLLHHVYSACSVYVTPAYAETFAHPLVEAMACGLPVVASDLPVHREICADAGLYFDRYSAEELCERVLQVAETSGVAERLSRAGELRASQFSWRQHVNELLELAHALA